MKFSGPVQLLASNFWAGESDQPAQRLRPWAKNGLFLENLSPLFFGLTQPRGPRGPQKFVGLCKFWILDLQHKIDPP